jgi:hypothetical protein
MTSLLQAIHSFVPNQAHQPAFQPQQPAFQPQQPGYQPQPQRQQLSPSHPQQGGGGGALRNFLGGGFGQAIVGGAGLWYRRRSDLFR